MRRPRAAPCAALALVVVVVVVVIAAADSAGASSGGASDAKTTVHAASLVKVSNSSLGFQLDVHIKSPIVGFALNIVSQPEDASVVATNGPLGVLKGFLLNYNAVTGKLVAWSPLERSIQPQEDFHMLAHFQVDKPGTYCIGEFLLVAPDVRKTEFEFQPSTANCTVV